jgi:hypothetical protein
MDKNAQESWLSMMGQPGSVMWNGFDLHDEADRQDRGSKRWFYLKGGAYLETGKQVAWASPGALLRIGQPVQVSNEREISVRYLLCEAPEGRVPRKRYRTLISRTILKPHTPEGVKLGSDVNSINQG